MKIYLAAPYAGRDILKEHLDFWTDHGHGHEVTCGWVQGTRPLGTESYGISAVSTDEEVEAHARMDLEDIDRADAVVHYTAQYLQSLDTSLGSVTHNLHSGGRHVETGYAIAKNKPVVILGPRENIFQRGLCLWADDLDGALKALELVEVVLP